MHLSRSFTAHRNNAALKREHYKQFYTRPRPTTATNESLRQIIQVIESTLNQGAQSVVTRSKTLDRLSRSKLN